VIVAGKFMADHRARQRINVVVEAVKRGATEVVNTVAGRDEFTRKASRTRRGPAIRGEDGSRSRTRLAPLDQGRAKARGEAKVEDALAVPPVSAPEAKARPVNFGPSFAMSGSSAATRHPDLVSADDRLSSAQD
jgi:hypothetical protein